MKNMINTTFMVNQTTVHQYAVFFHSPSSVGKVAKLSEISILKHDGWLKKKSAASWKWVFFNHPVNGVHKYRKVGVEVKSGSFGHFFWWNNSQTMTMRALFFYIRSTNLTALWKAGKQNGQINWHKMG